MYTFIILKKDEKDELHRNTYIATRQFFYFVNVFDNTYLNIFPRATLDLKYTLTFIGT